MTLTFFCNYLNHHQAGVADELYALLGHDFRFVCTLPVDPGEMKGGVDYSNRDYCLQASSSTCNLRQAMKLALESDVCVFGACSQVYAVKRAIENPTGLSFEIGERWLKRGWVNLLSRNLIRWRLNYGRYYRKANFYKLCASAYTREDDEAMCCYKDRHFKWGYFPAVPSVKPLHNEVDADAPVRLMWCARFIDWKHPELPLYMAEELKRQGYEFILDYYGSGILENDIRRLVRQFKLEDRVFFHGNVPNEEIHRKMSEHDIFIFTSDKREGWGVVANEALGNGCAVVASDAIGSIPFLIRNGYNGFIFTSRDSGSLTERIRQLLENRLQLQRMRINAKTTIANLWNPVNAAKALLRLIDDLQNGRECSIDDGPCSKA